SLRARRAGGAAEGSRSPRRRGRRRTGVRAAATARARASRGDVRAVARPRRRAEREGRAMRPLRIARHVHAREFAGELVILDMAAGKYFSLDGVGTCVWRGIERGESAAAIASQLVRDYDVEPARAQRDVDALLAALVDNRLLDEERGAQG